MKLKYPVPDSFLAEEVRNGYTISAEMKKVWAVQTDLVRDKSVKEVNI